jgi:hypothetical protein
VSGFGKRRGFGCQEEKRFQVSGVRFQEKKRFQVSGVRFREKKRFQVLGKDWGVSKIRTNFF